MVMFKKIVACGMCAALLLSNSTMVFALENNDVQIQSESNELTETDSDIAEEKTQEEESPVEVDQEEKEVENQEDPEAQEDQKEQEEQEDQQESEDDLKSDSDKMEEKSIESEQESQDAETAEEKSSVTTESETDVPMTESNVIQSENEEKVCGGSTLGTATWISFDTKYSGAVSGNNRHNFYKMNLSASGRIRIKSNAHMSRINYRIYDAAGREIWNHYEDWNSGSEIAVTDTTADLTSGTYYLEVYADYATGTYDFTVSYTNANETFKETQGGTNNSIAQANKISLGTTYQGQIAQNDEKDFYKIDLQTSGTLTLQFKANIYYLSYRIYDKDGAEVWGSHTEWNENTEQTSLKEDIELTSGIYYLAILKYSNWSGTGTYSFKTNFISADESFKETQNGSDNTLNEANLIRLNTTYTGQIAQNDEKDFFEFSLAADDTVQVYVETKARNIACRIFDESGERIFGESPDWNDTSKSGKLNKSIDLPAGNYYFEIERYGNWQWDRELYTGKYSFKLSASKVVNVDRVTGAKIGGRASNALRLNWNKNSQADGYIIEQYKGSQWTRIAKINGNATTTYRVENLGASNTYKFRIQAFKFSGNTPFYSEYAYVEGKTNPSDISGLRIGGHAKDALRLNWNRNTSASGYIIEMYRSGSWNRVARISDNTTVTYRVEKLSPNTKYSFRVKAFGFEGNTALYGNAASVAGTTDAGGTANPTNVSGFYIGGRASNALRLNWNRNSSAEGYIIEQYKNGSWSRIARISGNGATTKRVENLKASTEYRFRIQTFKMNGSKPLYSGYVYVTGKTNPYNVSGLRIGGRAADALRLNWNRNTTASGYVIEQYKNGSWSRIARISGNTTTTWRAENLKASTYYRFRIRAFGFMGNTALYSDNDTYVYGTTNPYNVSGARIAGTAADALRINWNRNTTADGYVIEKYQSGSWVRVARISENYTTTYRVEHLQPSTSYVFRIRAFKFAGNTPLYSGYSYVFGDTQNQYYTWSVPLKAETQSEVIANRIR